MLALSEQTAMRKSKYDVVRARPKSEESTEVCHVVNKFLCRACVSKPYV